MSLAYLLALVAMLAPAGRIADAVGRKLIYGYGFIIFTAASAACGLAPSLGLLIAFRVLQAAGAAMLQANSVALVATTVPAGRMRLALSVQAAAQAVGLGLGPTLGGLLTQTAGWRAVYWINVPVGCLAVIAGRYLLPRTRRLGRADSFDWIGAVLLAAASSGLLLVMSAAGGLDLPGWATAGLAAAALAAAVGFALRSARARSPLIPRALLRSGRLALALAGALLGYLTLFGPLVLIPQVLAGMPGGALRVGLVLSALPAGFGVAALGGEALLPARLGNRQRGVAGAVTCAFALVMLIFMPMSPGWVVPMLAVAGLGLGIFVPANNAVIMRTAGPGSASVLGGLVNMARGIGTTLGIALMTVCLHLAGPGPAGPPGATAALAVLAAAAAAAALIAGTIRPLRSVAGRTHETGPSGAFG